ncbi:MAG: serine hydrolase, partial [Rubripirellula sp.]
ISRSSYGKDEFIKLHCSSDLANEPGTIYSYCNAGYVILGRIIEKVTGKSFEQNLKQRIFEPLGMNNSGYDRNRYVLENRASGYRRGAFSIENADYIEMDSTPGASGALYSTVQDMFLWDRALYTDQLLSKQYRDLMFTPNRDVPEVKAAGGRPHSIYGYGWQIYSRTHPVTKRTVKVVNHGGAINGFRAMESRLVEEDAFVIVLCNVGDPLGGSDVWSAVSRLNAELINVITDQPYRMPGKARVTQDQRIYRLVKANGVKAAIDWFQEKGRPAAWGGAMAAVSKQLLEEGFTEEALALMEFDVESSPGKVWLLRKTAQAFLDAGQLDQAISYAKLGIEKKPDDEALQLIIAEANQKSISRSQE